MVQRFRVCVAMQQTLFQSLVGKILHATEQLNLCATTTELLQPTAHSPYSTTTEATTRKNLCIAYREQPPLAVTRESLCSATKTHRSQK